MGKIEKCVIEFIDSITINLMQLKTDIKEYEKNSDKTESINNINALLKEQREGNFKGILANQNQNIKNKILIVNDNNKINIENDDGGNAKMTKRKDGRLMARFRMENGNYKYIYGKTKKEVNEKLEIAKKEYEEEKQKNTLSSKMKLKDYINYYYQNISSVKETSKAIYDPAINTIQKSKIGDKKVSAINLDDLLNFVESQKESKTIQKNAIIVLKTTFAKLLEIGLIKYNYTALLKVDNTPVERNEHKYIDIETIYKMLNGCKNNQPLYTACVLLSYTGCRIGEVLALTLDDFDFENREININKQKTPNGKIQATKSKSSIRKAPIFDELYTILKEKTVLKLAGQQLIRKYLSLYEISPHDLRHTFATNCFILEKNAKQVQLWLGHSSYSMTIDTYTHCPKVSSEQKKLIERFFEMSE